MLHATVADINVYSLQTVRQERNVLIYSIGLKMTLRQWIYQIPSVISVLAVGVRFSNFVDFF